MPATIFYLPVEQNKSGIYRAPTGFSQAYTVKHRKAIRETLPTGQAGPTHPILSVLVIPTYKSYSVLERNVSLY